MDEDLRKALRDNMKRLRKDRGYSQLTLAEQVGISSSHIAEIEVMHRFPSPEVLSRIAQALGVTAAQLLMDGQEAQLYELFFQREDLKKDLMKEIVQELKDYMKTEKDLY